MNKKQIKKVEKITERNKIVEQGWAQIHAGVYKSGEKYDTILHKNEPSQDEWWSGLFWSGTTKEVTEMAATTLEHLLEIAPKNKKLIRQRLKDLISGDS